jgi:hypothetical protein
MDNDELLQKTKDALTALFSDTSVSRSKARENLRDVRDEIDVMLDTLIDDGESE